MALSRRKSNADEDVELGFNAGQMPLLRSSVRRMRTFLVIALLLAVALRGASQAQSAEPGHENSPPAYHHHFSDAQRWVAVFEAPDRERWQKPDEVIKALKLKPGQTVVDIGAGTGYFTRRFAKAVGPHGKAVGLDIEPSLVAYMRADAKRQGLSNYEARLVKPDDPELSPNSADLIFFCDVLHHIDNRPVYLRSLIPALRPNGRVAVIDFKKRADTTIGPPPRYRISRKEMIDEFRKAGFELIVEHRFLPYQYFLEFAPQNRLRKDPSL